MIRSIALLKHRHADCIVRIVGPGPTDRSPESRDNEVLLSINAGLLRSHPDYAIFSDLRALRRMATFLISQAARAVVIPYTPYFMRLSRTIRHSANLYFYRHVKHPSESANFADALYRQSTVLVVALSFAKFIGARKSILVECPLAIINGQYYHPDILKRYPIATKHASPNIAIEHFRSRITSCLRLGLWMPMEIDFENGFASDL